MLRAPTTNKATLTSQPIPAIYNRARLQRASKAAFDYLFVVSALILLLPLFLIVTLLIKLESPGPVLYKHRALGLGGRFFQAYSFRTTYIDGDSRLIQAREKWIAILNNSGSEVHDPRVTKVGLYLRRYGLDDLPRLFNILNRQMSLVGPHLLSQNDVARIGMRRVELLTTVKPGMTGLWQTRSYRSTPRERDNLEIDYLSNWSLLKDIRILTETLAVVLKGRAD